MSGRDASSRGAAKSPGQGHLDQGIGRILFLAFAAIGGTAMLGTLLVSARIESRLHSHNEFHARALIAVQKIDARVNEAIQRALAYVVTGDATEKREFRRLIDAFHREAARFRSVARLDEPDEEAERILFERIEAHATDLFAQSERHIAQRERGEPLDMAAMKIHEERVKQFNADIGTLVETEVAEIEQEHTGAMKLLEDTERALIGMGALILALTLYFSRRTGSAIGRRTTRTRLDDQRLHRLELRARESQKLESLGLLAGGIAHDFNNLLVGILGNAEIAASQVESDSRAREALDDIRDAGEMGAELTRELLTSAGRAHTKAEPFEVSDLVEATLRVLHPNLPRTVACETELESGLWVEGDTSQIRQVVMNLVTNAADALGQREGTIRVRTGSIQARPGEDEADRILEIPRPGAFVFCEVSDTGAGMDAATRERIFDPFFTTKADGRGLGLASMRGILQGHGGGVELRSHPERGTVFRVLLPQVESPSPTAEPAPPRVADRTDRITVLVVDDQAAVARATARILQAEGFDVLTAGGGREAIATLKAQPERIGGVVLDLNMPGLDGWGTFEALRAIRPDLPVVFYSGNSAGDADDVTRGAAHAVFLEKPFTTQSLTDKLREAGLA